MFEMRAKRMLRVGHKVDIGSDTVLLLGSFDPPCKLGGGICHQLCDFGSTDIGCA